MTRKNITCYSVLLIAVFSGFSTAEDASKPERTFGAAASKDSGALQESSKPRGETVYLSAAPRSAMVVAAKRTYERAQRNARLQYILQLDVALKEAMKEDDLEEVIKINTIKQRMVAEHLKDGGDVIAIFNMRGTRSWEDSKISVRKGQTIEVSAPDADINDEKVETINGISAPVGSLLMKVGGKIYDVGKGNEIVLKGGGKVFFRSNLRVSPNHAIKVSIVVK